MAEHQSNIIVKNMEEVMHDSMIPYSEHVILDRALPRVEDGLKPVQRRILFTMNQLGLKPDSPYRKSALTVGECLAKYHPHGDSSVYDAMVRMAQPFNMRACLVDGHGNFGSIDGDSAAAMRYTEAKLSPLAMELLRDLDKETVKWNLNFDDRLKEPEMLPGRYPNLLVNGASGIAVGLATNIPPHNLGEVIDGVVAYIDNRSITLKQMLKIIKGPDFPSGGFIVNASDLENAYETGKGRVIMRAKISIENGENDKKLIVITELPYQVNKASLLESIMNLREEKKGILMGISDIIDESDRDGMRAVIKIKRDVEIQPIINMLFKSTKLQQSFGINMVAIADGKPQQLGLMDIIAYYVDYQRNVVLRRSRYELNEAKDRAHILEGLVIAVTNIDEVVKIIKTSQNVGEAKSRLRERFQLSEVQAQAILDMRLARLTSLEIFKLQKELEEIKQTIARLEAIIASKKLQMELVKTEILAIKRAYKDARKTVLLSKQDEYVIPSEDDKKPVEECIIAISRNGLKRMTVKHFNMCGKDFSGSVEFKETPTHIFSAQSNEILYCFTNLGNCHKVYLENVSESKWKDKSTPIKHHNAEFLPNEYVIYVANVVDNLPKGSLLFYTQEGMVKKTDWSEYAVIKSSFQTIKLKEGDSVIAIEQDEPNTTVAFITKQGMCLNADKSDIPTHGRIAGGVKGIMLSDEDRVIAAAQVGADADVVLITDRAYAKRIKVSQIDVMSRYRKGVKVIDMKGDSGNSLVFSGIYTREQSLVAMDKNQVQTLLSSTALPQENRTSKGKPLFKGKAQHTIIHVQEFKSSL